MKTLARYVAIALAFLALAGPASGQTTPTAPALWPDLAVLPAVAEDGQNDAAVVVGIEKYASLAEIPGAGDNALLWFRYLAARKVPGERMHFLRDREATRERVESEVKKAASEVTAGGRIWFVFIGHGAPSRDQQDGVLVTYDAQQDVDSLFARSLPQKEVLDTLTRSKAKVVAIIDACFSGFAFVRDSVQRPLVLSAMPTLLTSLAYETPAVVLSAGTSRQFAGRLPGARRPAFSYLALGALRGWGDANGDGRVTPQEVAQYTQTALRELPIHRDQTPELRAAEESRAWSLAEGAKEPGPNLMDIRARIRPDDGIETPAAPPPTVVARDAPERHTSALVPIGIVTAAAGVVALGVGGGFALSANAKNNKSEPFCTSNVCSAEGLGFRNDAISAGNVATGFFIAGGVLTAAGLGMWLFAPSPTPSASAASRGRRNVALQLVPGLSRTEAAVSVTGSFP